jgi:hypothetical protein
MEDADGGRSGRLVCQRNGPAGGLHLHPAVGVRRGDRLHHLRFSGRKFLLAASNVVKFLNRPSSHFLVAYLSTKKGTMAETESTLPKMTFTKAFVFYYVGILAIALAFRTIFPFFPRVSVFLLVAALAYFVFHFLLMSTFSRAAVIHRCFDMGGRSIKETGLMFLVATLFFPLYPLLVTPIVGLAVIQMMRGKCNLD